MFNLLMVVFKFYNRLKIVVILIFFIFKKLFLVLLY
jgi:hypothetical protein